LGDSRARRDDDNDDGEQAEVGVHAAMMPSSLTPDNHWKPQLKGF
jgi:hypothetical protein